MSSEDVVKAAIASASRLSRQASGEARAAKVRLVVKERRLLTERRKVQDEAAETRVWRRILSLTFPIPFLRGQLLKGYDRKVTALDAKVDEIDIAVDEKRRGMDAYLTYDERASRITANLGRAKRAVAELGPVPPEVTIAATTTLGQCDFLMRSRRGAGWIEDALKASESAVKVVRSWAKARVEAEANKREDTIRREAAKTVDPKARIFLPIPFQGSRKAIRMGAHRDDTLKSGESQAFVTMDMDLKPFRDMLPLVYRTAPTRFEFPPIPLRAAGQNLWSLFDKETWNHVRHASYDMTGRRCVLCGKRGGWFADRIFGPEERRNGVDCHEVWEWEVPDESNGVGIQRLKRILVVCPDCHMMFHEGFAKSKARDVGLEQEAVAYLKNRRLKVNRMDEGTLQRSLEASREALGRMTGIDRWIVDLTSLSQQQFMVDRTAIMRASNDAMLPPDLVAGLAFETDTGKAFPARTAQEIYRSLLDDEPENDHNVVAFRR